MIPTTPDFLGIDGVEIITDARLSEYTTFRLGGPCRALIQCSTPDILQSVVDVFVRTGEPYILLGGGSNVLVSDRGYEGYVIRYACEQPTICRTGNILDVLACSSLDEVVRYTVDVGLGGLTCCSGIPGGIGGAIVGNAGAWGQQIADRLVDVTVMDRSGVVARVGADSLEFAYRRSRLQQDGRILLSARIALEPEECKQLADRREHILKERADKHPDLDREPCIGSIFRNIEPTSSAQRRQAAGWFLDQAGVRGLRVGGAEVYEKHANIIVARPDCTAQNVRDLAALMAEAVRNKFNLELVREVRCLGHFAGEPDSASQGFF